MATEIQINESQQLHQELLNCRAHLELGFVEMGRILHEIDSTDAWRLLGYSSFTNYLSSADVDIAQRTAFALVGIYRTFILDLQLQPLQLVGAGWSKLDKVRQLVDSENVEGWIARCETESRSDLNISAGIAKSGEAELKFRFNRVMSDLFFLMASEDADTTLREDARQFYERHHKR